MKNNQVIAKQHPYVQFLYEQKYQKTKVADQAGKFDETFELQNLAQRVQNGEDLVLEAFDQDTEGSDFLGATNPLYLANLTQDKEPISH